MTYFDATQEPSRCQYSFSKLWTGFDSDETAKFARDCFYRSLKHRGFTVKRWVLKNQLKQYESFGVPDGRSCDVYMLDVRL